MGVRQEGRVSRMACRLAYAEWRMTNGLIRLSRKAYGPACYL